MEVSLNWYNAQCDIFGSCTIQEQHNPGPPDFPIYVEYAYAAAPFILHFLLVLYVESEGAETQADLDFPCLLMNNSVICLIYVVSFSPQ